MKTTLAYYKSSSISISIRGTRGTPKDDDNFDELCQPMDFTQEELYQRNYFYQSWVDLRKHNNHTHPLLPMDVMIRYISQHSHYQLEKEYNKASASVDNESAFVWESDCRYLVATYSCPLEKWESIALVYEWIAMGVIDKSHLIMAL